MLLKKQQLSYLAKTPFQLERIAKYELDGDHLLARECLKILDIWNEDINIQDLRNKFNIFEKLESLPLYVKRGKKYIKTDLTCLYDGFKIHSKLNPRFNYYNESIYLLIVKRLCLILNLNIQIIKRFDNNFGYYSHLEFYKTESYSVGLSIYWLFSENAINFNIYLKDKDENFIVLDIIPNLKKHGRIFKQHIRLIKAYELICKIPEFIISLQTMQNLKAPVKSYEQILNLYTTDSSIVIKQAVLEMSGAANLFEWYLKAIQFLNKYDNAKNKKAISHYEMFIFEANKQIIEWLQKQDLSLKVSLDMIMRD